MGKNSKRNRRKRKQQEAEENRRLNGLEQQSRPPPDQKPFAPEQAAPLSTPDKSLEIRSDGAKSVKVGSTSVQTLDNPEDVGFGSRKRKLADVGFVHPGLNGFLKPYVFGSTRSGKAAGQDIPAENPTSPGVSSRRANKKTAESLEDILFAKKQKKELTEPSAPEGTTQRDDRKSLLFIQEGDKSDAPGSSPMTPQVASAVDGQLSGYSVEEVVNDKIGCRPRANSTDGELNLPQRGLCDERMVLQSYKWDVSAVGRFSPKGFMNLGNTCYLNSTLQCLAYLPPFSQSIMAMPSGEEMGEIAGKTSPGRKITLILRSLFRLVHSSDKSAGHAISPRAIVKAVPSLGSSGSRRGYKFRPGRQEDSHEFLVHLLDSMNDGELRQAGINQHVSGWRDRLPVARLEETTFVHRIFGGYLRSQVLCTNCGHKSNTYDPFLDLSLEVSRKNCNSVASALQGFTRKETLDSENRWKCSDCKKRVCATKQLTVFRPPLSLCIPLKRFAYGGSGGGSFGGFGMGKYSSFGGGKKITKPIDFPIRLNLPLSDNRSCAYQLTGLVVHVGGSASSGHYTAFVRKPGKGAGQWFHMDDSFVEAVSEKTVLRQKDAYVLFYCREEVVLEFPQPPLKSSMTAAQAKELGRARSRARADSVTDTPFADVTESKSKEKGKGVPRTVLEPHTVKKPSAKNSQHSGSLSFSSGIGSSGSMPLPMESSHKTASAAGDSSSSPLKNEKTSTSPKRKAPSAVSIPAIAKRHNPADDDRVASSSSSDISVDINPASRTPSSDEEDGKMVKDMVRSEVAVKPGAQKKTSIPADAMPGSKTAISKESSTAFNSADAIPGSKTSKPEESATSSSDDDDHSAVASPVAVTRPMGEVQSGAVEPKQIKPEKSPSEDEDASSSESVESPLAINNGEVQSDPLEAKPNTSRMDEAKSSSSARTRVVLDRGEGRGKVEVMLGPRFRSKIWESKGAATSQGDGFDLLGNVPVSKWDDDNDEGQAKPQAHVRSKIMTEIKKKESERKRKMFQDRWDSVLDQGKTKKVKNKVTVVQANSSSNKMPNAFQRIQASVQRMNKGRAKGYARQQQAPRHPSNRR